MATQFKTRIERRDVSIYNAEKHFPQLEGLEDGSHFEIEPREFTVLWNFEIEARDWGVKDMSWYVTNIEGGFDIVLFDEDGDEAETFNIDFDFGPFREAVTMEIEMDDYRQIQVQSLEIDYQSKGVLVQ